MKQTFSFTLEGRDWSRLYFWYWGPMLALMVLSLVTNRQAETQTTSLTPLFLSIAISFLTMMLQSYFAVPIYRTWLGKLTIDGRPVGFGGDIQTYLLLNVKGFLLSTVTLGVYLPWYARNVLRYLAKETTFEGEAPAFTGKPSHLLWKVVGALVVFLLLVGFVFLQVFHLGKGAAAGPAPEVYAATAITFFAIVLLMGPFLYLVYQWTLQFRWRGWDLRLGGSFVSGALFVLGQVLLTLVTLGFWWPAASVHLYRFFVGRVELGPEEGVDTRLVFEGKAGEAYGFLWGQALLTAVTLGFYGAWSGPAVTRWFTDRTFAIRAN